MKKLNGKTRESISFISFVSTCASIILLLTFIPPSLAQQNNRESIKKTDTTISSIRSKEDFYRVAEMLPFGIEKNDQLIIIFQKIENYINLYKTQPEFKDDPYILATIKAAIEGGKKGEFCIGAVLTDEKGKIILSAHNSMLSQMRTDLHGEMTLLTLFETNPAFSHYRKGFTLNQGMTLYSSAEPCPMCLIRIASAGVKSKYGTSSGRDGMAHRLKDLPDDWRKLCEAYPCTQADCSPILRSTASLLFYTFYIMEGMELEYGK